MSRERQPQTSELAYVETSAILADILERDERAHRTVQGAVRRATSALTVAEAYRKVVRTRVSGELSAAAERDVMTALEAFFTTCHVVSISEDIIARAGRTFAVEPVRTLDAIHLATIESLGYPPRLVTVITRDRRVRENALALGCQVE